MGLVHRTNEKEDLMANTAGTHMAGGTVGSVIHGAARYDFLVWVMTLGRERRFRERILRLAHLQEGESVLDVGCGTGSLAIIAKQQVGPTGVVCGIDASPEMITRANKKARKAGVEVTFKNGAAQALPFSDAQFDVVLSTLMLHHIPRDARQQCAHEIRRVLKPSGRVLAVDFAEAAQRGGFLAHFHRHDHVDLPDIVALLSDTGLHIAQNGAVGRQNLQFVVATAASSA